MVELRKGMLAKSKAGHDAGKVFVIKQADSEDVYLVDGRSRTLDHPKKKKRKHIQVIYRTPFTLEEVFAAGKGVTDETVKKAIKEYNKNVLTERV